MSTLKRHCDALQQFGPKLGKKLRRVRDLDEEAAQLLSQICAKTRGHVEVHCDGRTTEAQQQQSFKDIGALLARAEALSEEQVKAVTLACHHVDGKINALNKDIDRLKHNITSTQCHQGVRISHRRPDQLGPYSAPTNRGKGRKEFLRALASCNAEDCAIWGTGRNAAIVPKVEVTMPDGVKILCDPTEDVFCTCRKPSYGAMVGCENEHCQYEWFHLCCVGMKEVPEGDWWCPECTEFRQTSA